MIANLGPIGVAILVAGALLTLACVCRKPRPDADPPLDAGPARNEPRTRNAPKPAPMTAAAPAPEAPEVQPQDIRPYANGAVTLGESDRPTISVREPKEAAK